MIFGERLIPEKSLGFVERHMGECFEVDDHFFMIESD